MSGLLTGLITRPGKSVEFLFLINGYLRDEVGGVAKAVNADSVRVTTFSIGAIAKHSGAQKRRNLDVVVFLGQMETKARVGNGELGVTAVDRVAGELRIVAKVLARRSTISAIAVGPAKPRDADPVADFTLL